MTPLVETNATYVGVHAQTIAHKNDYFVHEDGCKSANCQQCNGLIEALELTRCFYCCGVLCWKCWDDRQGVCRGCVTTVRAWSAAMQKARTKSIHKNGRPKRVRVCSICRKHFGARELRKHKPFCVKPELHAEAMEAYGTPEASQ